MKLIVRAALAFLCLSISTLDGFAQSGMITTVAGSTGGFSGDGGAATSAQLAGPSGVAVDTAGNLYIADEYNSRIRKVTAAGVISTVAGNGTFGFLGDGGPAISASLSRPIGVAVDAAGNLYIADYADYRIRKVTVDGVIITVAGNGTAGFSGDGGPATSAQIANPFGVAVDTAGNLYIADFYNSRVRKVTAAGVISTVAGNGLSAFSGDGGPATSASLSYAAGVAVDAVGNLYIADYANNRIRKVTAAGVISTVAGNGGYGFSGDGGAAISAQISEPRGVAVDSGGNLYIADADSNSRIRKVTVAGVISTVAGNGIFGLSGDGGAAIAAQLSNPYGIAVDTGGNFYIADLESSRIRKVDVGLYAAQFLRGDFNGDGKSDILWQNTDGSVAIWLMNGLSLVSGGVVLGPGTGWSVKKIGDFNGDGKSDILWQKTDGSVAIWLMNGLSMISGGVVLGPGTGWSVKKIGDFNGDGKSDILWQKSDGSVAIWLMNGLSMISGGGLLGPTTGWSVVQVGDFNGDGKSDIIWQHNDGSTAMWLMNGLSLSSGGGLLGPGTGWSVAGIGDFNGDGKSDIVWQNADGSTAMWIMNGLGLSSGTVVLGAGTGWSVKGIGDFNGDGKSDIVWQNTDGSTAMWLMNGLGLSSGGGLLGAGTGWSPARLGDFNGDSKSDILWQNTDGSTAMWVMNGLSLVSGGGLLEPSTGWSPAP